MEEGSCWKANSSWLRALPNSSNMRPARIVCCIPFV
ncbi:Uncharacterised protein [Vibrio cholerae]|nr:Uncharacterised protein [Vibrio cholerae]